MSEQNIAVVRRFFDEVWNQRRDEAIDELLTDDSICYGSDGPLKGPHEFREKQYVPFLAAFPDFKVDIDGVVAQGDEVVVRWTATGVHQGEGFGLAATFEKVTFQGMTWVRVRDGKMMEGWQSSNIPETLVELTTKAARLADS